MVTPSTENLIIVAVVVDYGNYSSHTSFHIPSPVGVAASFNYVAFILLLAAVHVYEAFCPGKKIYSAIF